MTNGADLKRAIIDSGVSITFLANRMGCSRNRIYAIIDGAECTASEITELSKLLHLTKAKRDHIFLSEAVN